MYCAQSGRWPEVGFWEVAFRFPERRLGHNGVRSTLRSVP